MATANTAKKTTRKTTRKTAARRTAQRKTARQDDVLRVAAHTLLDTVEGNLSDTIAAVRALVDAKDLDAALKQQRKYVESALKRTRTNASKLSELTVKALEDAGKPLVERVKQATNKVDETLNETLRRAA